MKDEEPIEEKVYPYEIRYIIRFNAKNGSEALQALVKIRSALEKDENIQNIRVKELKTEAVQYDFNNINMDL